MTLVVAAATPRLACRKVGQEGEGNKHNTRYRHVEVARSPEMLRPSGSRRRT